MLWTGHSVTRAGSRQRLERLTAEQLQPHSIVCFVCNSAGNWWLCLDTDMRCYSICVPAAPLKAYPVLQHSHTVCCHTDDDNTTPLTSLQVSCRPCTHTHIDCAHTHTHRQRRHNSCQPHTEHTLVTNQALFANSQHNACVFLGQRSKNQA